MQTAIAAQCPSAAEGALPAESGLRAGEDGPWRGDVQVQNDILFFICCFGAAVHQRTLFGIFRLTVAGKRLCFVAANAGERVSLGAAGVSVAGMSIVGIQVQVHAVAGDAVVQAV